MLHAVYIKFSYFFSFYALRKESECLLLSTRERGPRSSQLCSHHSWNKGLGKLSQTETGFKMNFLPMKGENAITSYCTVLTFKSVKIWWLVKAVLVFLKHWIYFSWMMTESIKLLTLTIDGCLILDKLVRRRGNCVRECRQYCSVNCWNMSIFIGFFWSHPNFAPLNVLCPILLWPGEVTHSELLGTNLQSVHV